MRAFFMVLMILISGPATAQSVSTEAKRWMALFASFAACAIHDDPVMSEYEMKAIFQKIDGRFREKFGVLASDVATIQKTSMKTPMASDCERLDRTVASIIAGRGYFGSF